jgi:hypothetical protein
VQNFWSHAGRLKSKCLAFGLTFCSVLLAWYTHMLCIARVSLLDSLIDIRQKVPSVTLDCLAADTCCDVTVAWHLFSESLSLAAGRLLLAECGFTSSTVRGRELSSCHVGHFSMH